MGGTLGGFYLGSGVALLRAVKKYGEENFTVKVIEECTDDKSLTERENYCIRKYDAVNSDKFYNLPDNESYSAHGRNLTKKEEK